MQKLFIYCCGGLGKELLEYCEEINKSSKAWASIGFIDDSKHLEKYNNIDIYSLEYVLENYILSDIEVVIASGEPRVREVLHNQLKKHHIKLATIISQKSQISKTTKLEEGSIIINSILTSNINIGKNVLINNRTIISHDVFIGNNSVISPGSNICGSVTIGDNCFIGAGTILKDEIKIGHNTIVGIGSLVISDLEKNSIYYGAPAKYISENNKERIF